MKNIACLISVGCLATGVLTVAVSEAGFSPQVVKKQRAKPAQQQKSTKPSQSIELQVSAGSNKTAATNVTLSMPAKMNPNREFYPVVQVPSPPSNQNILFALWDTSKPLTGSNIIIENWAAGRLPQSGSKYGWKFRMMGSAMIGKTWKGLLLTNISGNLYSVNMSGASNVANAGKAGNLNSFQLINSTVKGGSNGAYPEFKFSLDGPAMVGGQEVTLVLGSSYNWAKFTNGTWKQTFTISEGQTSGSVNNVLWTKNVIFNKNGSVKAYVSNPQTSGGFDVGNNNFTVKK